MSKEKRKECLVLFCKNPVCQECEENEFCALHVLQIKVLGKETLQTDYSKRLNK